MDLGWPCIEICAGDALTTATVRALTDAVTAQLAKRPSTLWLNLEAVKMLDVVGAAAVAQAVRRARRLGVAPVIFPSSVAYRGLLRARLCDLPLDKRRPAQRESADTAVHVEPSASDVDVLRGDGVDLTPATWDDVEQIETWAREDTLERLADSELLALCREHSAYHPLFVSEALASPTALTLLIRPAALGGSAAGFVRLYNVNFANGFAFVETLVSSAHAEHPAWSRAAFRRVAGYAVDALELHRLETKALAHRVSPSRAPERDGFALEARLRDAGVEHGRRADVLVFGILEPEIRAHLADAGAPAMHLWPDEPA